MKKGKKISCQSCRHYYVTWDKHYPAGCRALNFKSKTLPCLAVFNSSGLECLSYTPRVKKNAD